MGEILLKLFGALFNSRIPTSWLLPLLLIELYTWVSLIVIAYPARLGTLSHINAWQTILSKWILFVLRSAQSI